MENAADTVFYPELSNLGDVWLYFNILLSFLKSGARRVKTAVVAANGLSVESKLLEMQDLFEHGTKILLVQDMGQTKVHNWRRILDFPQPYLPTLVLWQDCPKRRICYQFDGAWKKEIKNPPPEEEAVLTSWLPGFEYVRLGGHLTLRECVEIASEDRKSVV